MSIGDLLRIKRSLWRFKWETIRRYYPQSGRFGFVDLVIGCLSIFVNPYRICRKHQRVYGETPCSALHRIADVCSLSSHDVWLDLGSGRGIGCFWVAQFIGCQTIGVESISIFHWTASVLRRLSGIKRLKFIQADITEVDVSKATCVYLYSTCMSESELEVVAKEMEALPAGAKIVTVSGPLPETKYLSLQGTFPLSFPWGETEAYLHVKKLWILV